MGTNLSIAVMIADLIWDQMNSTSREDKQDQNPSRVDNHTFLSNQPLHNSETKGTIESGNQYQKPQIGRKRKQGSDQKRKMWTAEQQHHRGVGR